MLHTVVDNAIRIFTLDLKEYVEKLWDENIPVVRHAVIEAVGIEPKQIDHNRISANIEEICNELDFHIVKKFTHNFTPQGASIVFILEESHLAIHTWPEKGYIHMDVVTCSKEELKLVDLVNHVTSVFKPKSTRIIRFKY